MKKSLLTILTLFFVSPLWSLNVLDIRGIIRKNMRDNSSTNPRYSNAMILDLMNEGQAEINNQVMLSNGVTNYVLTPMTSYYILPNDFQMANEVYFKKQTGETIKLTAVNQNQLYQSKPDWERIKASDPNQFWISDSTYSIATGTITKRVSYIPVPNWQSTGTISMWYYTQMVTLANDSDIPFNGQYELLPYHYTIVYYVTMRLKIIDGIIDESNAYNQLYNNSLLRLNNYLQNVKPQYIPQTAK
jgi:hypothetical protein